MDFQNLMPTMAAPAITEDPDTTMRRMFEQRGLSVTPELRQAYLQLTAQGVMPHEAAHRLWVQQPPTWIQPPRPLGGLLSPVPADDGGSGGLLTPW